MRRRGARPLASNGEEDSNRSPRPYHVLDFCVVDVYKVSTATKAKPSSCWEMDLPGSSDVVGAERNGEQKVPSRLLCELTWPPEPCENEVTARTL